MVGRCGRLVGVLGVSMVVGVAHAQYRRSDVSAEERAIRRRNSAFLFQRADELYAEDPSNPDVHTMRGTAYALEGWPIDAAVEFELATGGDFYEKHAMHYHAEALRDLGRLHEAAALREEWRVVDQPNLYADIALEIHIVEDLRLAGAWDEGLDAVDVLLATAPGNVLVHAYAAHFFYDMGDLDEALFQLFLGARHTQNNHRYQEVLAVMAFDDGMLDETSARLVAALRQRPRYPRLRALQLRAWCDDGNTDQSLREAAYPRFANHVHPLLMASESRCHAQAGDIETARRLVDEMMMLYPDFVVSDETAAFVEALATGG